MKCRVTLKSEVSRGTFYWVCDVEASSEDEAKSEVELACEKLLANLIMEDYSYELIQE